jgi:hypothetical protein
VICCGEEHERRNRDVAGYERQRLCCCGGHLARSHSVCEDGGGYGEGRRDSVGVDGGGVLWFGVDAALRWSSKLSERTCGVADVRAPGTLAERG